MLGIIVLILLLGSEIGFMVYRLRTKEYHEDQKKMLSIGFLTLLTLVTLLSIVEFGFRWNMLFFVLFIKAVYGVWYLVRGKYKNPKLFRKKYVIMSSINNCFLFFFALIPAMLFPQFEPITITGDKPVNTVSYTITDQDRTDPYSNENHRNITIQFWFPENQNKTYPLLIFSHGAFGFRGSNASTFENLASNGYVVCSIDHTYHSFFTKHSDGKIVIADMNFINDAIGATNGDFDAKNTYDMSKKWLQLRVDDMNFVLEDILTKVGATNEGRVYELINTDKIGVFGHSLGGATSAEIGRRRSDIDAVVVIDGTMFGEAVAFENGAAILNKDPYPVPILNLYNEEHYQDAMKEKESYPNVVAEANAMDGRHILVEGSGHLNFTDLPMFSPFFARMLGTGDVNRRYCIETMNQVVLDYFDYYLKDSEELRLQEIY